MADDPRPNDHLIFPWNWPGSPLDLPEVPLPHKPAVCECGAEKCGTPHSHWCPKYAAPVNPREPLIDWDDP